MAMRATRDTGAFAAVVRGKRIEEENTTSSYTEYEKALRQFERAYRLDPGYADALGLAAQTLATMSYSGGTKMLDSAAVLARRALVIDPNQANAVATLAFRRARTAPRSARDPQAGGAGESVQHRICSRTSSMRSSSSVIRRARGRR